MSKKVNNTRKVSGLLASIILICLYVNGAIRHSYQVNTDMLSTDQSAYMAYAKTMRESNYTYVGSRNRMPVYPFIQSFLYKPGTSDEEFFVLGKQLNIMLSAYLLAGTFWILLKFLPLAAATNLILVTAFTVFIFKAAYFQTELLFYFFNFCCFLLMNKMLHRPRWQLGILTGLMLGLAHLTKASVIVGLILFLIISVLQEGHKFQKEGCKKLNINSLQTLASIACVPIVFLIIIFPYIHNSKKVYGSYFYNVNSTFYMWYDSWDEAKNGTSSHGDQVGWPDMPPEEIPSPSKYLREHTVEQIINRFMTGFLVILSIALYSYGYFKYVVVFFLLAVTTMIVQRQFSRNVIKQYAFLFLFNLAYFGTYLALCAWYTPIASGNRLTLAQFLPLMFTFSFIIFRLYSHKLDVPYRESHIDLTKVFTVAIVILLVFDLYIVLSQKIVTLYGGA